MLVAARSPCNCGRVSGLVFLCSFLFPSVFQNHDVLAGAFESVVKPLDSVEFVPINPSLLPGPVSKFDN